MSRTTIAYQTRDTFADRARRAARHYVAETLADLADDFDYTDVDEVTTDRRPIRIH